jgi:hypothetical protein
MATIITSPDTFDDPERAFLNGLFACRGIQGPPTNDEFEQALACMSAYAMQIQDDPPERECEAPHDFWVYRLSVEERVILVAIAFVRFVVTKPGPVQWEAAHRELFGPAPRAMYDG